MVGSPSFTFLSVRSESRISVGGHSWDRSVNAFFPASLFTAVIRFFASWLKTGRSVFSIILLSGIITAGVSVVEVMYEVGGAIGGGVSGCVYFRGVSVFSAFLTAFSMSKSPAPTSHVDAFIFAAVDNIIALTVLLHSSPLTLNPFSLNAWITKAMAPVTKGVAMLVPHSFK